MQLPDSYNYIALFLTMRCNYKCSYCINWKNKYDEKDSKYWIENLSKMETNLPVTIGGGEPSLHKGFIDIINHIPQKVDILTNLSFDVLNFINKININKFDMTKAFAPIRVSFHSEYADVNLILHKIKILMDAQFRIGLYCVESEENKNFVEEFKRYSWLDFQTKPLLDNSVKQNDEVTNVKCKTKELLLAPNGKIYRCHRDLYKKEYEISTLDKTEKIKDIYRLCTYANECHPCDIKVKRDRFGKYPYCAVSRCNLMETNYAK